MHLASLIPDRAVADRLALCKCDRVMPVPIETLRHGNNHATLAQRFAPAIPGCSMLILIITAAPLVVYGAFVWAITRMFAQASDEDGELF